MRLTPIKKLGKTIPSVYRLWSLRTAVREQLKRFTVKVKVEEIVKSNYKLHAGKL